MGDIADDVIDAGFAQMREDEERFDDFDDYDYHSTHHSHKLKSIPYKSIVRETEKAWQIEFDNGRCGWYPKSRCTVNADAKTISIPDWLYFKMKNPPIVKKEVKNPEFEYDPNRDKHIVVLGNCEKILHPDWTDVDTYYSDRHIREIARDFENSTYGVLATKNPMLMNYFSNEFAKKAFFEVVDGKLLNYFRNGNRVMKLKVLGPGKAVTDDYVSF